ncbi:alkaline phosphatase [candidate division KSB1 bacterium]|nr:alkaline phosphatase [candidate division KSB1 bacterium]
MKILKAIFMAFIAISLAVMNSFASTPKNIIFMISDGCGYHHIDAASIFQHGKIGVQVYEQFPVKYGMSTYSLDGVHYEPDSAWSRFDYVRNKPTDSAASGTAMATGVKTYNGAIGVDTSKINLKNIIERLEQFGKATGVVTTVPFSHATPACFVAHNEKRSHYVEIARDMILNSPLEVIMGAGHPYYDESGRQSSESSFRFVGGKDVWLAMTNGTIANDADHDGVNDPWTFIEEREDFQQLMDGATPKRVIGIPKVASTLQQERDGDQNADPFIVPFIETVPKLEEMTQAALNVLDDDPDGFFVMIEGGAVDWAGHDNQSGRMIEEEIDFNRAVEAVVNWVEQNSNWDETLVIVTADHETGYLTGPNSGTGEDGKPIWNPFENRGKGVLPGMEWHSGSHTNSLIPFFAKGAGSELFHQFADETDPIRGRYLDNAEVGKALFLMFERVEKAQ